MSEQQGPPNPITKAAGKPNQPWRAPGPLVCSDRTFDRSAAPQAAQQLPARAAGAAAAPAAGRPPPSALTRLLGSPGVLSMTHPPPLQPPRFSLPRCREQQPAAAGAGAHRPDHRPRARGQDGGRRSRVGSCCRIWLACACRPGAACVHAACASSQARCAAPLPGLVSRCILLRKLWTTLLLH